MAFISVASKAFPSTKEIYGALNIPLGCVVTPCLHHTLQQLQFPSGFIVKCENCRSYISPYCVIHENTWDCGICSYKNSKTVQFAVLNDYIHRPQDNYEIYADETYMKRPPICPSYVFLLDVSEESINNGYLATICDSISSLLQSKSFPGGEKAAIGIILFDSTIHYVYFNAAPQFITVSSPGSDIWVPFPIDYLVINIEDNLNTILASLSTIKNTAFGTRSTGYKNGLIASELLLEKTGGKVLSFLFNPTIESSHPKNLVFLHTTEFYEVLGEEFIDSNISCDVFVSSSHYSGLYTLGHLSKITGGDVYYYQGYYNSDHLISDISKAIETGTGWEAVLRLKTTPGWKVTARHGHFYLKKDLLVLPCLKDSSFAFELAPVVENIPDKYLTIQASVLYTNPERIRLIRVMNCRVPTETSLKVLLESFECDTLINLLLKQSLKLILKRHLILSGQKYLEKKSIELMKSCLIVFNGLPSNLESFLLKILGLMKHIIFINPNLPCKCN